MARVSLSGVGKRYPGAVEAVRDLTLDVADGELMVLVGPSGSGKSTVLRLVAGLESLTDGRITIGDRVADTLHPKDRDVAMVFQDYALYPHMTVAENIGFSLRVRRVPRDEVRRRVERAAAMLGLDGLLDRKPHALSGGQQQRVALGRAIVREPAAFLFDEPLSNLDAALRVSTRAEIKSLQKRLGTTALYVTHDQEEAMTLADRLAVLAEGRLQQLGTPLEVYRRPANRFVASFIGSPPMCFVDGTLDGSGEFAEAVDGGGGGGLRIALPAGGLGGRDVVLGVRPHALTEDGDGPRVDLTVDHVETLGATMDVIGTTAGGARLVARLPAREGRAEAGRLALALDTSQTCLFEPGAYGRSLWPAG